MSAPRPGAPIFETVEGQRIRDADATEWRRWGPYLSERQWGTVREDYSADGDAWSAFPHDHARSRAYRWGEDGIAGFCDEEQTWCLSLGLWNGADPILKERLFGLTNAEGNHGEDVKEYYFFLDGVRAGRWRILVGEDAHKLDAEVRKRPEEAYDGSFSDLISTLIPSEGPIMS